MSKVVGVYGQFGNSIFQLSAGIKLYGTDIKLNPYNSRKLNYLSNFYNNNIEFTYDAPDICGYRYINKKYLIDKNVINKFLQYRNTPVFDVVMHIRGGDYKQIPGFRECVRPTEVLQESINILGVKNKEVIIITDDIPHAMQVMPKGCRIYRGYDAMTDWYSIFNASCIILSPGTFSYTAAYLGNPQTVVFPRLWVNQFQNIPFNLKMDDWIEAPI